MAGEVTNNGKTYKKLKWDGNDCAVEVALKDGKGNQITDTYATKTEVSSTYATKAYADGTFATITNLQAEIDRSTAKDTALGNAISDEAEERVEGDSSTLSSANSYADSIVANEKSARETADSNLQTKIDAERTYADNTFATIATEQTLTGSKTFTKKITASDGVLASKDKSNSTDYAQGKITNTSSGNAYALALPTKSGTLALKSDVESASAELTDYIDESVNKEAELRATGDEDTLTEAKAYSDAKTADCATKTYVDDTFATKTELGTKLNSSDFNAANIVSKLGTTPVNRATGDKDGNSISETYAKKSEVSDEAAARANADNTLQDNIDAERAYADATFVKLDGDETIYGSKTFDEAIKVGNTSYGESAISDGTYAFTLPTKTGVLAVNADVSSALSTAEAYTDDEIKKVNSTISTLDSAKVNKSGDTMTGALNVPTINAYSATSAISIATGKNASSYFQSQKFRGEGDASAYYHAIDFGYANHDMVDFYEYGGTWNFWKNTTATATSDASNRVASLQLGKLVERGNTLTYPGKSGTLALASDVSDSLSTAKSYADEKVSAEASARETGDANTLTSAKAYADDQVSAEASARATGDSDTLTSAKGYADTQISAEAASREEGDTSTLNSAKAYVDEQIGDIDFSDFASLSKGNSFTGDQVINGDLTVNGTFKKVDAETLSTKEYTIGLAKGNTTAIASYVGLYATKYDGTNDGALVWDNSGTAYVGDCTVDSDGKVTNVSMQPIMTRADASALSSNSLLMWDATNLKAVKAGSLTSSNVVTTSGAQTISGEKTFTSDIFYTYYSQFRTRINSSITLTYVPNNYATCYNRDYIQRYLGDSNRDYYYNFPKSSGTFALQEWVTTQLGSYVAKSGSTMTGQLVVPSIKTSKALDANGTEWFNLGSDGYEVGDSGVNMQLYGLADRPTYNGGDLMLTADNKLTASDVTISW